jgi:hypothetical protein
MKMTAPTFFVAVPDEAAPPLRAIAPHFCAKIGPHLIQSELRGTQRF